jgi:hypothetical protein
MAGKNTTSDGWDWDDDDGSTNPRNSETLQESEMTPLTEGSTSEDCTTGWFGGLGADFTYIAKSLKDAVPPTIGALGDIASFVQRSARSVAAEIAQLENDCNDEEAGDSELRLPWEILMEDDTGNSSSQSSECREDAELKAKILLLSIDHDTFLKPFSAKGSLKTAEVDGNSIVLDEPRIHLIRRLLEIDESLAATHACLSGRVSLWNHCFSKNPIHPSVCQFCSSRSK